MGVYQLECYCVWFDGSQNRSPEPSEAGECQAPLHRTRIPHLTCVWTYNELLSKVTMFAGVILVCSTYAGRTNVFGGRIRFGRISEPKASRPGSCMYALSSIGPDTGWGSAGPSASHRSRPTRPPLSICPDSQSNLFPTPAIAPRSRSLQTAA